MRDTPAARTTIDTSPPARRDEGATELGLNDIGRVRLRATGPLCHDPCARNRATGSFILMDEATNTTVAGGMLVERPRD